jgi:HEAT repeat protein
MIPITVELSCGGGTHPVVVSLAFWGHVVAPSDPFSESLGAAFARMVPQECYEAYRQIVEALEACAPLMIERVLLQGRASHDSPDFQSYWQALLDACAHAEEVAAQLLQGTDDSVAYEWALAVAGSPAVLADYLDSKPLQNWVWGNQLWLLRRAVQGDQRFWKFLWSELPKVRAALQEPESLVALAMGLGQSQSDYAWDTLELLLAHGEVSVRVASITAVGQLEEKRALPALRQKLHNEQEPPVIDATIRALGAIGDAQDAGDLIEYAFRHPTSRAAVRDALVQMGNNALDAIENALRDLPDETMKEVLLQALQSIATPEVVPLLARVARHSDRDRLRLRAIQALRTLSHETVIPHLIHALDDPHHRIRQEAYEAIVERGDTLTDQLLDALQNPQQWRSETRFAAQWSVGRALAKIGSDAVKQSLMELAEGYDLNQRWAALTALRYADYPDLSLWMANQIRGSVWTIQHECALYLIKHPNPETIPVLMEVLNNPSPVLREIFERAIAENHLAAIPMLQRHFHEWGTFPQKQSLIRILRQIGHPACRPMLEELAQDNDERIAREANEALDAIPTGV